IYNVDLDSSIIPNTKSAHLALLKGVVQGVKPEDVLIETKLWFETFAAVLTEAEAKKLAGVKGVLKVMPGLTTGV
ncbi:unnamed protein product, partial [Linum tenue]